MSRVRTKRGVGREPGEIAGVLSVGQPGHDNPVQVGNERLQRLRQPRGRRQAGRLSPRPGPRRSDGQARLLCCGNRPPSRQARGRHGEILQVPRESLARQPSRAHLPVLGHPAMVLGRPWSLGRLFPGWPERGEHPASVRAPLAVRLASAGRLLVREDNHGRLRPAGDRLWPRRAKSCHSSCETWAPGGGRREP